MNRNTGRFRKFIGIRRGLPYVRQADQHRDRGEWIEAVMLYRRGLEWLTWREDLKVQIGNCLKEYGDYEGAVLAYRSVGESAHSEEAEAQIADVNRRAGVIVLPYSIGSKPTDLSETSAIEIRGVIPSTSLPGRLGIDRDGDRRWLGTLAMRKPASPTLKSSAFAAIKLDQVGSIMLERDRSSEPVLAGVIAIRGQITSKMPIDFVEIVEGFGAGERVVLSAPVSEVLREKEALRLFVFNLWIDSATLSPGRSWLAVRVPGRNRPAPAGLFVNVLTVEPDAPEVLSSIGWVPSSASAESLPPASGIEQAVLARPAEILPASRSLFDRPIRSILVIRADQLGDLSASLPAWRDLRELFPDARITALVQPTVAAVIAASGLADEIETIHLEYDAASGRRYLSSLEERRVRGRLGRYDLAIDLCPGSETRTLLLLCEAVYLVGFEPDRFRFLDFGVSIRSRDKLNRLEKLSHAGHVAGLIAALSIAVAPHCGTVPRTDDAMGGLDLHGLESDGYALLHTGARHPLNQWPLELFAQLANMIVERSDLSIAIFGEPGEWIAPLIARHGDRIRLLPVIDPDAFDRIISSARVMVGNDSGPKHLAAVRGVPTVSVHVARLNWNEWGQEGIGAIVAKRVPCSGCGLNDIALCGREAVCVRSITAEEVFEAVLSYLGPKQK